MGIGAVTPNAAQPGARAVFLDRDGVLNRALVRNGKPYPPASLAELELVPGAAEALGRLKDAGFRLIVVTNQPDVARGAQTRAAVDELHRALQSQLPIDEFRVCDHDDADECACRKPRPGLLLDAAAAHGLDLPACYLIGDRWRDIEASQRAGCPGIFIDYGYAERAPSGDFVRVASLPEAVAWILVQENNDVQDPK